MSDGKRNIRTYKKNIELHVCVQSGNYYRLINVRYIDIVSTIYIIYFYLDIRKVRTLAL